MFQVKIQFVEVTDDTKRTELEFKFSGNFSMRSYCILDILYSDTNQTEPTRQMSTTTTTITVITEVDSGELLIPKK